MMVASNPPTAQPIWQLGAILPQAPPVRTD